jgi:hypothetical protein
MELGIIILTIGAIGLAVYQGLRERTTFYVVALIAGMLSTLPSPLWQLLYGFRYQPNLTPLLMFFGNPLPRMVFLAGWIVVFPALVTIALSQRRAWFTSYLAAILLFTIFLVYHMVIETVGTRSGWWGYITVLLPLNIASSVLAAIMNALVSLGILAALQVTRHYTLGSLLLFLLPIPLLLRLFVHGILGAPIFTGLLLRTYLPSLVTESWADLIGVLGTAALVLWAIHLVASTIARQGEASFG